MYKRIIRPLLFKSNPEKIHHFTFNFLKVLLQLPGMRGMLYGMFSDNNKKLEREVFGLRFKNPVGLAAGFDKDARLYNELAYLGFGFIEIGTVTPEAQPGNEKPRLFRLEKDEALINRMGFNNKGAKSAAKKLRRRYASVIIGGNIGKNKNTPNDEAIDDYEKCFEVLFDYVDYFVVNVSSPNTPDLRSLQDKEPLTKLLNHLSALNNQKHRPKPILLKIAPDLSNAQLDDIIEIIRDTKTAGVIATNTTIDRNNLKTEKSDIEKIGAGGLSGKPLRQRSTEVIRYLHNKSGGAFPIIGVGGIHSADDAMEKLEAGASLVQLYTGFIYEGPALIKQINRKILAHGKNN